MSKEKWREQSLSLQASHGCNSENRGHLDGLRHTPSCIQNLRLFPQEFRMKVNQEKALLSMAPHQNHRLALENNTSFESRPRYFQHI